MTVEEIIEKLYEIVNNQGDLSVKDLVDIVESISVEDRIASDNALTIFYTGESEKLINRLVETANENVRIIRRTDAYKFLNNESLKKILEYAVEYDNPSLSGEALKEEVNRLLYEASHYDDAGNFIEGEGFWTIISRRFAAETTGDAYSLCCNGKIEGHSYKDTALEEYINTFVFSTDETENSMAYILYDYMEKNIEKLCYFLYTVIGWKKIEIQ